jgi:hypothetical protein
VTVHACDSAEEYQRMLAEESALAALTGTG